MMKAIKTVVLFGARAVLVTVVLSVVFLAALVSGCGASSADGTARHVIEVTAVIVDSVDVANAEAMAITRDADIEASATREEAIQRREVYWRVQESVDGLRFLLLSAEAFVDAAGGEGFRDIAACIAGGVVRLAEAVAVLESATGADYHSPGEVGIVLSLLDLWGGQCEVPGA